MTSDEVFVVDDDESIRRAVNRLLRSAGYDVRTFASALEAIGEIRDRQPACLVVDIRMPGCTGLDLVDVLRKASHAPAVIFMTGHGDTDMAVRAMKAGAVDFLAKPFDGGELLDAVAEAVSTRPERSR